MAAQQLGTLLATSVRIRQLKSDLVGARTSFNPGDTPATWRGTLALISERGNNRYLALPMRFIDQAKYDPTFARLAADPSAREFLQNAQAVQTGAALTSEWLRSRFSGYPSFGVPQLAPGSPRVEPSLDMRWPWIRDFRPMHLETRPAPAEVATVFGLPPTDFTNALGKLGATILTAPAIEVFSSAWRSLDDQTRRELFLLRQSFTSQATDAGLDAVTQSRLLRRDRHRDALLHSSIEAGSPLLRAYCQAFDDADELIEDVMSVVSYVAFWGPPIAAQNVQRIRRISRRWTELDCRDFRFVFAPLGIIVEPPPSPGLDDPILVGGMRMHGIDDAVLFGTRLSGGRGVFGPPPDPQLIPWVHGAHTPSPD